jgi:hypothetical protein
MDKYCLSCGLPLTPEFKGAAENYCQYCTDEKGNLKSRDEIKMGVAEWMKSWQPDIDQQKAMVRAENYLNAMPAWAD